MGGSSSKSEGLQEEELVRKLSGGEYKNIVIMCGAGISVNAGIPDFRSPSAGLYFKLRKYNLPYPEAVFDGGYFRQDPRPFYGLIREIFPETLSPTTTHKFFSLLHQKGLLRRIYTQNIDALEVLAGIPPEKIIEAHGSFQSAYCTQCQETYDLRWLKREIFSPETNDEVPKCEKCQAVVRPDVVLFGQLRHNNLCSYFNQVSHCLKSSGVTRPRISRAAISSLSLAPPSLSHLLTLLLASPSLL